MENPVILKILAYIGLTADIISIAVFISDNKFSDFWSRQWILSIVLILILFSLAMAILKKANTSDVESNIIMGIFGAGYTILGIVLYIFFAHKQTSSYIYISEYIGYWFLFAVLYAIGLYCVSKVSMKSLQHQAYAYGAAILYVMILLIYKYVFNNEMVELWTLTGEVLILVVGSVIFFGSLELNERFNW